MMKSELIGNFIDPSNLIIPKAKALYDYIKGSPKFINFIEVTYGEDSGQRFEIISFEIENEIPQRKTVDIRETEQVSVQFFEKDLWYPEISVLRKDFPSIPHLNLRAREYPKSLCLYEQDWNLVNLTWTPADFINRLRFWFKNSSTGDLHGTDQPLEPFLSVSSSRILIEKTLLDSIEKNPTTLYIGGLNFEGKITLKVAKENKMLELLGYNSSKGLAFGFTTQPLTHGIINQKPKTLFELEQLISLANISILNILREKLTTWNKEGIVGQNQEAMLVVFITIPLKRTNTSEVESFQLWAFLMEEKIKKIGEKIGIWKIHSKTIGLLLPPDETKNGSEIALDLLNVSYDFSPEQAAFLNGKNQSLDKKISIIGLGALGSKIFDDLIRMGYSSFALMDGDILLPHNLSRHSLGGSATGYGKTTALAQLSKVLHMDQINVTPYFDDILNPLRSPEKILEELKSSELILDISASETVPRYLARDIQITSPIISLFLSPSGMDLILLKEDKERVNKIDCIEQQYYRLLCRNKELGDLLFESGKKVRYARSCRDVTSKLPTSNFSIFSGIASAEIDRAINDKGAKIFIWRLSNELEIKKYSEAVSKSISRTHDDWTVLINEDTIMALNDLRYKKLPNETGGVLLGTFDTKRKNIYISHYLSAPPDSQEKTISFSRGKIGLAEAIREIDEKTTGRLRYVGEWHSHPKGCSSNKSKQDMSTLSILTNQMAEDGLPFIMLIIGESDFSIHME